MTKQRRRSRIWVVREWIQTTRTLIFCTGVRPYRSASKKECWRRQVIGYFKGETSDRLHAMLFAVGSNFKWMPRTIPENERLLLTFSCYWPAKT